MAELLTADGLAGVHGAAAGHVGDGKVPGLVAVVARGDQVHAEVLGSLAVGGPPVRRDSLFRIASITKPVTGVATLALAAEGRLRLDEPVDQLLPELAGRRVLRRMDGPLDDTVPARRAITVRDLLTFTFGFGFAADMFGAMSGAAERWPVISAENRLQLSTLGEPDPARQPDPDTWMAGLGSLPLLAQPGERWFYNTGASVLGVLCARAAGQPFGAVLRSRVFEPLGMRDTGFWTAETGRLATAYRPAPAGLRVWDEPGGVWSKPPPFEDGAAGLVSTADDLLALSRMLLRGGAPVLSARAAAELTRDQLTTGQKAHGGLGPGFFDAVSWGYCVSVVTGGERAGAFGWAGGFGSTWLADPGPDLTVIVLTQRTFDGPGGHPLHDDVQAAAYAALG
ncbi:MAG TPA: serine hydrolase domain-containing protein [Streptosporangiaceae bacterium]|nr:serine hydrolase domain-containing protein [Streptosporangiaceae bacterium]